MNYANLHTMVSDIFQRIVPITYSVTVLTHIQKNGNSESIGGKSLLVRHLLTIIAWGKALFKGINVRIIMRTFFVAFFLELKGEKKLNRVTTIIHFTLQYYSDHTL